MAVKEKKPAGAILAYRRATLIACMAVQTKMRKVLNCRTLLYPKGVPAQEAAAWALVTEERIERFLKDHRHAHHLCPPPQIARLLELELQRREF